MKTTLAAAITIALSATAALPCSAISDDAERLACYDQAHSEISLIRCTDLAGSAKCDLLTPTPNDLLSCTVYDDAGKAIARETGFGGAGLIVRDMDADQIDHVDCVKVM